MDETELLGRGVELMLVGMGTVIMFLTLLVLSTSLMTAAVSRFLPDTPALPAGDDASEGELLAVVSAAVTAYRSRGDRS